MTGGRGGGSRRTSLNVCSQDDSDLDRKSFGTKKKKIVEIIVYFH